MEVHTKQLAKLSYTKEEITSLFLNFDYSKFNNEL
jgi:hypothetical protein